MPENNDNKKINPQITTAIIGVREMREIKIYPLSIADQLEVTDLIAGPLGQFSEADDQSDSVFIALILDTLKKNLSKVLTMATDEDGTKIMKDLTNKQAVDIGNILYEVNYEPLSKNVKSLWEKIKTISPSQRPLQQSVKDIMDTNLKTSTESPGEKEE